MESRIAQDRITGLSIRTIGRQIGTLPEQIQIDATSVARIYWCMWEDILQLTLILRATGRIPGLVDHVGEILQRHGSKRHFSLV